MGRPRECNERVVGQVLGAAVAVHRCFGPGLLESVYESALALELACVGLEFERQVEVYVRYRGRELGVGFRADLVIERSLLVELKCVESLNDVHLAQVLTYLRLLDIRRGLLLNFNTRLLKHGIRRISI